MRWLVLVVLAACGDPSALAPCLAGHSRATPTTGCYVATASIGIDGITDDWSAVPAIPVAPSCTDPPCAGLAPIELRIAAGGDGEGDADLRVLARFGAAPPTSADLRVVWIVEASARRPGTIGIDRLVDGARYEKNGFVVGSSSPPWSWAWTSDGFEAAITGTWLAFQGAGRISVSVERQHGDTWLPVAPTDPLEACWGWRSDPAGTLGVHACEVTP